MVVQSLPLLLLQRLPLPLSPGRQLMCLAHQRMSMERDLGVPFRWEYRQLLKVCASPGSLNRIWGGFASSRNRARSLPYKCSS
ncbi:hypothetical protein EDB19DRAFT_1678331 [Suillus lakei]|nr:hypothetical protein EDB19DRAFT_1821288 [Suillus lakei]KAG1750116.1 hypothetical protein EDB19DRAFT_1678331 [Suillus lakei]